MTKKDTDTKVITKKRFIAGAVCPSCQALDRLVVEWEGEEAKQRRCVSCGFTDQVLPQGAAGVPKGKLEKPKPEQVDAQKVHILDPKKH